MSATWLTGEVAALIATDENDETELDSLRMWLLRRFPKQTRPGQQHRRWSRPEVITAVVLHSLVGDHRTNGERGPLPFHI